MPISDGLISARQLCTNSVDTRHISPDAITPTEVASGFNFVELVTVLPTTGNFEGRMVYLTTDDKLYRHDGAAFLLAVDGADISAGTISGDRLIANTITAGQIQAATITATELNVSTLSAITASMGTLTIDSTLTMATGAVLRTASSGQRLELTDTDFEQINCYTGDSFEALPGRLEVQVSGTGATRTLQLNLESPATTGDTRGSSLVIRSESNNDSTSAPGVVFQYNGGSSQTPEFIIGDGIVGITDLGSASAPAIGIGTGFDDGLYSPADGQLSIALGGNQKVRFENTRVNFTIGDLDTIQLPVKSTTGDPTGNTGDLYLNTTDNALRLFSEGAWRTVFSY